MIQSINATPAVIRLDITQQATGSSIINYTGEAGYITIITERIIQSPLPAGLPKIVDLKSRVEAFIRESNLPNTTETDEYIAAKREASDYTGTFRSAILTPGSIAEYKVYIISPDSQIANFNPATNDFLKDNLLIYCVKTKSDFGLHFDVADTTVGGTFIQQVIRSTRPAFIHGFICYKQPLTDASGFLSPDDIATWGIYERPHEFFIDQLAQHNEIERSQLLPGNNHFLLLRLIGSLGEWDCIVIPFTTKKRRLELKLERINIINNGGSGGGESEAEARFTVGVSDGDDSQQMVFNEMDLDINTKVLNINWHVQFRPRKVSKGDKVMVLTMGEESDSPDIPGVPEFSVKETAVNYSYSGEELLLPFGRGSEEVNRSPLRYHAKPVEPDNGDYMEFTSTGWFGVTYI